MKVNVPCPNEECELGFLTDYGDDFYCPNCKKTFRFIEVIKGKLF